MSDIVRLIIFVLVMEKETKITFRTTEELRKKLQAMADKDNRTLSSMIELLLKKATDKK